MVESAVKSRVLEILERITGSQRVIEDPDVSLFDEGLLDSLAFVELIVALSEELSVPIILCEIDRNEWHTPRNVIDFVERHL